MEKKYFSYLYTIFFLVSISNHNGLLAQGWQWQNPLPQGNTLSSIIYIDDNTVWASVFGGGSLLKSTNGGDTWKTVVLPERIYAEDVFFINEDIGWMCGEVESGGYIIGKVLSTIDGGENWNIQLVDTNTAFRKVIFANIKTGWVTGDRSRIFHTTNGGENWKLQADLLGNIYSISLIDSIKLWAANQSAANGALFYTNDGGKNWLADSTINWAYDIQFVDSLNGWVSGRDKIAHTSDGGKIWATQLNVFPIEWTDIFFADKNYGWALSAGQTKIAITTNGGEYWAIQNNPAEYALEDIAFTDSLIGLAVGSYGIIMKTSDGGKNWDNVRKSVTNSELTDIFFIDNYTGWIAGWNGTLLKTTNAGNEWNNLITNITEDLNSLLFIDLNQGFAVGDNGIIIRTTDGGNSWSPIPNPLVSPWQSIDFNNYPNGWIIGGDAFSQCKLIKSSNGGLNWNEVPGIFFSTGTPEIQFTSEQTGWIMIGDLSSGGLQRLYKTSDGGENWELILSNYSDTSYYSMHFISDDVGWISTFPFPSYILYTTNGGISWEKYSTPESFLSIFFIDSLNGWGASLGEIYKTSDGGKTWTLQRAFSTKIQKLKFINNKLGFAIGSFGDILYTTTGGITDVRETKQFETNEFFLYQNYPNPFNSETIINFYLPEEENSASIFIFDILGRIVKEIEIRGFKGNNTVTWDGKTNAGNNAASGAYIYSIVFKGRSLQKKLIYLK